MVKAVSGRVHRFVRKSTPDSASPVRRFTCRRAPRRAALRHPPGAPGGVRADACADAGAHEHGPPACGALAQQQLGRVAAVGRRVGDTARTGARGLRARACATARR